MGEERAVKHLNLSWNPSSWHLDGPNKGGLFQGSNAGTVGYSQMPADEGPFVGPPIIELNPTADEYICN